MEMSKVNDWLEGIPSKATRKSYMNGIKKFEEFFGKPIETLIDDKKAGRQIEKFYVWLKEKGYSQNSFRNIVNGVVQYLKFFDTPVKYRRSLGIYRPEISTRDHMLQISEVQRMADIANPESASNLRSSIGRLVRDACRSE